MMLPPGRPGHSMHWIDGAWVSVPIPPRPGPPVRPEPVVELEPDALPPSREEDDAPAE